MHGAEPLAVGLGAVSTRCRTWRDMESVTTPPMRGGMLRDGAPRDGALRVTDGDDSGRDSVTAAIGLVARFALDLATKAEITDCTLTGPVIV